MRVIYRASDPAEAQLLRGFLVSRGITAVVTNQWAFQERQAPLDPGSLPEIMVPAESARDAAELIKIHLAGEPRAEPVAQWECPTCSERHESQFTACWRCGADRGEKPPATPRDPSAAHPRRPWPP